MATTTKLRHCRACGKAYKRVCPCKRRARNAARRDRYHKGRSIHGRRPSDLASQLFKARVIVRADDDGRLGLLVKLETLATRRADILADWAEHTPYHRLMVLGITDLRNGRTPLYLDIPPAEWLAGQLEAAEAHKARQMEPANVR